MGTFVTKSRSLDKKTSIKISYPFGPEISTPITKVSDQTTYGYQTRELPSDRDLVENFSVTSLPRRLSSGQPHSEVTIDPKTGKPARTSFDNGHPFSTTKRWESYSHPNWGMTGRDGIKFQGPLLINGAFDGGINFPVVDDMSQNDVNYYGSLAIANTTPTAPAADLATFIGETATGGFPVKLDDVFSHGTRRNADGSHDVVRILNDSFKSWDKIAFGLLHDPVAAFKAATSLVGNVYIASSFAWKPFVSDIEKLCRGVINQNALIKQYIRDGSPDKIVRRRYAFPQIHEIGEPTQVGTAPFWKTDMTSGGQYVWIKNGNSSGPVLRQDQSFTDIWFSGAYSYLVYDSIKGSLLDKMEIAERNANYVLGSRLTPEALWEMAPWSWLADYKFNIGNVISNLTNFEKDNLVLRYGYLMRKTHKIRTYSTVGPEFVSGDPGTVYRRFDVQRKERYKATPYGFGVDPESFTSQQWSILVALGMTKGDGRFLRNE